MSTQLTPGRALLGDCRQPLELIYGCYHQTACGRVIAVVGAVDHDPCGRCFLVREDWHGRQVRVRREANGNMYEAELASD